MYSKIKGQSLFQAILCGEEEMPGQKSLSVWVGISFTPHKMAWNTLCPFTLEYTFYVAYLAPDTRKYRLRLQNLLGAKWLRTKSVFQSLFQSLNQSKAMNFASGLP